MKALRLISPIYVRVFRSKPGWTSGLSVTGIISFFAFLPERTAGAAERSGCSGRNERIGLPEHLRAVLYVFQKIRFYQRDKTKAFQLFLHCLHRSF